MARDFGTLPGNEPVPIADLVNSFQSAASSAGFLTTTSDQAIPGAAVAVPNAGDYWIDAVFTFQGNSTYQNLAIGALYVNGVSVESVFDSETQVFTSQHYPKSVALSYEALGLSAATPIALVAKANNPMYLLSAYLLVEQIG